MFETAELGQSLDRDAFESRLTALRPKLLQAQRAAREAKIPILIIISGAEAAGKSEVVKRLREWLDTRGVSTSAFWDESDEERERPEAWRYFRKLPARGSIGIFFGSWYTKPIIDHATGKTDTAALEAALGRIVSLERMLVADGMLVVKFWFHLSKKAQKRRLKAIEDSDRRLTPWEKRYRRAYQAYQKTAEISIFATDKAEAPWHVIESKDPRFRDLTTAELLLEQIEKRLADLAREPVKTAPAISSRTSEKSVLSELDLSPSLPASEYGQRLADAQSDLAKQVLRARKMGRSTVVLFEGSDAAGKGGAIRRLCAPLDGRLYEVIPVAAPSDEERARHYLWRFWRHLPRAGYVTIYDRSWYGRVLVERVEGFASHEEWGRAYQEINDFEHALLSHGIVLGKFWLQISKDEQLRRFSERESLAHKQHKITEEDYRNRARWDAYEDAVHEMVARCSTGRARIHLIPGNDKKLARVLVVEKMVELYKAQL